VVGFLPGAQQLPFISASKIVVRISMGCPVAVVLTTELTSTGSRVPSAARNSRATPPISPCMFSSGAKCVSWYSLPPAVSRSVK
jgi:hypothetical protein